jgi:hypothetical protein
MELIIGVIFILTFVTINLFNMSDNAKTTPRPTTQPAPSTEEKGRTIPQPPQGRPTMILKINMLDKKRNLLKSNY